MKSHRPTRRPQTRPPRTPTARFSDSRRPSCKKRNVSPVWAISRRNVVIGKYLPSGPTRGRPSRRLARLPPVTSRCRTSGPPKLGACVCDPPETGPFHTPRPTQRCAEYPPPRFRSARLCESRRPAIVLEKWLTSCASRMCGNTVTSVRGKTWRRGLGNANTYPVASSVKRVSTHVPIKRGFVSVQGQKQRAVRA